MSENRKILQHKDKITEFINQQIIKEEGGKAVIGYILSVKGQKILNTIEDYKK